ncbi:hypothetical protein [Amycolatopsis samaneae]|uniref:SMI1/KNR4 family protein n=1 Tax=Amycolatopsis samaneae TaxID=664691 RepID=A0ABW5GE69_9PSEU
MAEADHFATIDRVGELFRGVVARGLRPGTVAGATDAEIDDMAAAQESPAVPVAAREVLRLVGKDKGPFAGGGGYFGVDGLRERAKQKALEFFDEATAPPAGFRDPEDMLVLLYHGGYLTCVVDGADLTAADPPVWLLEEDGTLRRQWAAVTDWFAGLCAEVGQLADELADARAHDRPDPGWAGYFERR